MDKSGLFIFGLVFVHLAGIMLFVANVLYLKTTRGHGSARISVKMFNKLKDLDDFRSKRCCKTRNVLALNILILYHAVLCGLEVILAVICQNKQSWNDRFNMYRGLVFTFWVSANLAFIIYLLLIILIMPPRELVDAMKTHAHIGHIHACDIFEFLISVTFWAALLHLLVCACMDCSVVTPLNTLPTKFGVLPPICAYLLLFISAVINKKRNKLQSIEIISKQETVRIIMEKLQQPPSIG